MQIPAGRSSSYFHQDRNPIPGVGEYGVPALPPVDVDVGDSPFVRFDMALRDARPEGKIVHFFTDDWMFDRIWKNPDRYVVNLGRFRAIVAPDFSLYADFPKALQVYNHFRKHWVGAYLTAMGMTVIPCIRWIEGDNSSFGWCLDGEPRESTICMSTHGCLKSRERREHYVAGWETVVRKLRPSRIILYGERVPGMDFEGDLIQVRSEILQMRRGWKKDGMDETGC